MHVRTSVLALSTSARSARSRDTKEKCLVEVVEKRSCTRGLGGLRVDVDCGWYGLWERGARDVTVSLAAQAGHMRRSFAPDSTVLCTEANLEMSSVASRGRGAADVNGLSGV